MPSYIFTKIKVTMLVCDIKCKFISINNYIKYCNMCFKMKSIFIEIRIFFSDKIHINNINILIITIPIKMF